MRLGESLDRVADYNKFHSFPYYKHKFSLEPDLNLTISCTIYHRFESHIKVDFSSIGKDKSTKEKTKSNFKIFSTLVQIIQDHVKEYDITTVECTAFENKKLDIYEKLFERFGPEWKIERRDKDIFAKRK
jgi:hypothetical protein